MTRFSMKQYLCILLMLVAVPSALRAQENQSEFESSTEILNTKILFAIGAREGEQQIRGSFGWPTFQEGFVEGVYFRFDPDGYARFSTSPRLDENVFEIQCRPGTTACVARKPGVEIGLVNDGRVQLVFSGIEAGDTFFLTDKNSELPIPPTIIEPLDPRLETLLASSTELVVKRQLEVIQTVPLNGINAVFTYLRWVSQQQSSRVFPRGWPVPAQTEDQLANARGVSTNAISETLPNQATTAVQTIPLGQQQAVATALQPTQAWPNTTATTDIEVIRQQMESLQLELSQLQNAPANAAVGVANPYPARSNENFAITVQPSVLGATNGTIASNQNDVESVDAESGISFAQQAQGRALPEPTGLNALGIQDLNSQTSVAVATGLANGTTNGQQGLTGVQPAAVDYHTVSQITALRQQTQMLSQEIAFLRNRLNQLETRLVNSQRQTMVDLNAVRTEVMKNLTANSSLVNVSPNKFHGDGGDVEPVQGRDLQATQTQTSSGEADQLGELEKLLLERLSQRDIGQTAPSSNLTAPAASPASADAGSSEVSVERSVIEELLSKLEDTPAPAPAPETDSESSVTEPTVASPAPRPKEITEEQVSAPAKDDGFVTLSDYINKVLEAEGLRD